MKVLIVESSKPLGAVWKLHLVRLGATVLVAATQEEAVEALRNDEYEIIILDLVIEGGSAFAVADFASYRRPDARVVFVTNTTFFSDGSIFQHIPNAYAFVPTETPPEDLVAIVEHYAEQR
jgi:DNA-binding response OmpR family regulator